MRVALLAPLLVVLVTALAAPAGAAADTWTVDPAASEIWFEARATQNDFTGVGGGVSGWVAVDREAVAATGRTEIRLDARTIRTHESNPTGLINRFFMNLLRVLETDRYPYIDFRLSSLQNVKGVDGGFEAIAVGVLRVRNRPAAVTSIVRGRFDGDRLRVEGEFPFRMSSVGIRPPRLLLGMLRVNDEITVKYRIAAVREIP